MKIAPLFIASLVLFGSSAVAAESFDCLIEPHMVVKVGSPILGILESVPVERGDLVEKGQLVTQLDAKIEIASVELATIRLQYLTQKLNRLLSLQKTSMASDESVDEAATEMQIGKMELQQRRLILDQKSIKSPITGVVVQRLLSPGEYAYEQTPLMEIAQIDPLNIEVLVPLEYYNKLKKGGKATVVPDSPVGGKYRATVEVVDKVMDAASETFGVRLTMPNPELKIPAGVKCSVKFES